MAEPTAEPTAKRSKFADAPPAAPPDDLVSSFLAEIAAKPKAKPPPPPAQVPSGKPPPQVYFDVLRGEGEDEGELLGRMDLSGASQLTFGRDASRVDVPLEHGSISRHHATITFDADVAYISDIKSTHGTSVTPVDGTKEKITTLTRLDEGSSVQFGESSRRYVLRRSAQGVIRQQPQPLVQQQLSDVSIILQVPSATCGRLTGQKGRALEQVRFRTGATMRVLPPPAEDRDDGLRGVEIKGPVDAVSMARLELLAITQCRGTPAPLSGDGQRFRYASTVVSARGDDDDLYDGGQFGKPGKI